MWRNATFFLIGGALGAGFGVALGFSCFPTYFLAYPVYTHTH